MLSGPVLIFSRDIGGTNQMVALREYLVCGGDAATGGLPAFDDMLRTIGMPIPVRDLTVIAKDYALECWRNHGVSVDDWRNLVRGESHAACAAVQVLDLVAPALLLTATTDVDDRTDVVLWQEAGRRGIPTAAFVDHRINLNARFFDLEGGVSYPDRIFVIDDSVRAKLVQEGAPADRVAVTGDLHLRRLASKGFASEVVREAQDLRRHWGLRPQDAAVLFVSECLREMRALGSNGAPYDEIDSLSDLLDHLRHGGTLGAAAPGPVTVVVRPHPKDTAGKFDAFRGDGDVRVIVDGSGAAEVAICAADVIVGMDSTMLDEAKVMGRPVHSDFRAREQRGGSAVRWGAV